MHALSPKTHVPRADAFRPREPRHMEVLFGKYAGNEIRIDGVEHLIMREDDILAIID